MRLNLSMRYSILPASLSIPVREVDVNLRLRLEHRLPFRTLCLVHLHDLLCNNRAALAFLGRDFYDDAGL